MPKISKLRKARKKIVSLFEYVVFVNLGPNWKRKGCSVPIHNLSTSFKILSTDPGVSEWWCINYGFITWRVSGNVTDFTSEVWYAPRGLTSRPSNQGKCNSLKLGTEYRIRQWSGPFRYSIFPSFSFNFPGSHTNYCNPEQNKVSRTYGLILIKLKDHTPESSIPYRLWFRYWG